MSQYHAALHHLSTLSYRWLITGAGGFIGSHLVETLLGLDQKIIAVDDFSTGTKSNLKAIQTRVSEAQWQNLTLIEANICDASQYKNEMTGVDYVLHQAALASVPLSIDEPITTHETNVNAFVTLLQLAHEHQVKRVVYATSSAVYGDDEQLPKVETDIGRPLSPYAASKRINEIYASVYSTCYGLETIGLRYFNIFGPRQRPDGAYAAVIPQWISKMKNKESIVIYGDGKTSRDFCFVSNAVQANILAALTKNEEAINKVYNVAMNERITLEGLFGSLRTLMIEEYPHLSGFEPQFEDFREGDVRHSQADISRAVNLLGYQPTHTFEQGLRETVSWFHNSQ